MVQRPDAAGVIRGGERLQLLPRDQVVDRHTVDRRDEVTGQDRAGGLQPGRHAQHEDALGAVHEMHRPAPRLLVGDAVDGRERVAVVQPGDDPLERGHEVPRRRVVGQGREPGVDERVDVHAAQGRPVFDVAEVPWDRRAQQLEVGAPTRDARQSRTVVGERIRDRRSVGLDPRRGARHRGRGRRRRGIAGPEHREADTDHHDGHARHDFAALHRRSPR
jgi:hypothetical protein